MNIRAQLESRISAALTAAAGAEAPLPALVAPAANAKFGDYQANGVMAAAKRARCNPRELAGKVLDTLDLADLAEKVEIAGPGFINITLRDDYLAAGATIAADDDRLDVAAAERPRTVVVDYSSPNLAKEMHVGHLRSTIIGDSLANVLEFLEHKVIRQNHVGDWGTQFGMLLAYMDRMRGTPEEQSLADLEGFYRRAKQLFDMDPDFAKTAREYVVKLQAGDKAVGETWALYRKTSLSHCAHVYRRLGVGTKLAGIECAKGESSYRDRIESVINDLQHLGMLEESEGALCVFPKGFKGHNDERLPFIIRKSDGGYLYATTDLAAVQYRTSKLKADRILYVTDSRQALHFAQLFAVAREAEFASENVSLEHVAFGMMLGSDGRPFKTREGGTVKLTDLLDEAVERAAVVVEQKSPDLPAKAKEKIARAVGIGAVKYADLSMDRTSDYKFTWEKMLALQGNTAPYMQYAYARVRSIFRKGAADADALRGTAIALAEPAERDLAKRLLRLEEILTAVAAECKPNILTTYLFELASEFSTFYETCPVLKADPATRASRLRLCDLTARTIRTGLALLGIDVIEQM